MTIPEQIKQEAERRYDKEDILDKIAISGFEAGANYVLPHLTTAQQKIKELEAEIVSLKDEIFKLKQ